MKSLKIKKAFSRTFPTKKKKKSKAYYLHFCVWTH